MGAFDTVPGFDRVEDGEGAPLLAGKAGGLSASYKKLEEYRQQGQRSSGAPNDNRLFIFVTAVLVTVGGAVALALGLANERNTKHSFRPHAITGLGTLEGVRLQKAYSALTGKHGTINAFLGIPYAENAPVGAYRFRASKVRTSPYELEVTEVKRFGPACYQSAPDGHFYEDLRAGGWAMSEDCLLLNVWTPASGKKFGADRLPVLVYVHGGGLQVGSASVDWLDGQNLALALQAVVVTVNYRLGPLGFVVGANSAGEGDEGNGGMNGFNDIITALQWLQAHVGAFGGDVNKVTLAGEGCGGVAACTLGASPRAAGLLQSLILQSGACGRYGTGLQSAAAGENITSQLLVDLGLAAAEQLVDVEADSIRWPDGVGDNKCTAFVDSWVALDYPYYSYLRGLSNVKRAIVGATSKDAPDLTDLSVEQGFVPYNEEALGWRMKGEFGQMESVQVLARYSVTEYNNSVNAFISAYGDARVVCPSLGFAKMLQGLATTEAVYHYVFSYGPESSDLAVEAGVVEAMEGDSHGWASHGADTPFVFYQLCRRCSDPSTKACKQNGYQQCVGGNEWTKTAKAMSNQVADLWSSFIHGGDVPMGIWSPVMGPADSRTVSLRIDFPASSIVMGFQQKECMFWEQYPPAP